MLRRFCLTLLAVLPMFGNAQSDKSPAEALFQHDQELGGRGLSAEAALDALFADQVMVPLRRTGGFAKTKSEAVQALVGGPFAANQSLAWQPIRAGVSADGTRGFSAGYQTIKNSEGQVTRGKYLAFWKSNDGAWNVYAYRVIPAPSGTPPITRWPNWASADKSVLASDQSEHAATLRAAEQAFSDRAQIIRLGPAFAEFGQEDSLNLGGPADIGIVKGSKAIGALVGAGEPAEGSSVYWAADAAVDVADSGDLGVTFGFIRIHPGPDGDGNKVPPPIPFFTVWARADAAQGWRYIAE